MQNQPYRGYEYPPYRGYYYKRKYFYRTAKYPPSRLEDLWDEISQNVDHDEGGFVYATRSSSTGRKGRYFGRSRLRLVEKEIWMQTLVNLFNQIHGEPIDRYDFWYQSDD